jgi:hypothetical protein
MGTEGRRKMGKGSDVWAGSKQNNSMQEYSPFIVDKDTIVRNFNSIKKIRIINTINRTNHQKKNL